MTAPNSPPSQYWRGLPAFCLLTNIAHAIAPVTMASLWQTPMASAGPFSLCQCLQQRIPPVLVELDVQLGGHLVREVEQLAAA